MRASAYYLGITLELLLLRRSLAGFTNDIACLPLLSALGANERRCNARGRIASRSSTKLTIIHSSILISQNIDTTSLLKHCCSRES